MDYNISSRRFRPWGSRVMALSMKCDYLALRTESREEWILRDVHRPTDRRPSAPQENQCLLSQFLTTLGTQEKTDCKSMLWSIMDNIHGSIDSCQNKVSAEPYHLTVLSAQVSTHRGEMIAGASLFFKNSYDIRHYVPALLRFWFQTNLGHENSASYLEIQAGKTFFFPRSHVGHALRPIFLLWLVKIWTSNLFTLTAEAVRVLCQLSVFFHWM